MSLDHRLDDELRKAFKREQPLEGFTARILEQVALEGTPRESPWMKLKKLAMLLEPPKLRWVAIGVTASLLLTIGLMQYSSMKTIGVDEKLTIAATDPARDSNGKEEAHSPSNPSRAPVKNPPAPRLRNAGSSSINHRVTQLRHQEQRELRAAEGEAAKETLMLALSIASSTLNDAQKAVHDDGLKP
jgi:hypothetical protein